jgi:hypothetical protein
MDTALELRNPNPTIPPSSIYHPRRTKLGAGIMKRPFERKKKCRREGIMSVSWRGGFQVCGRRLKRNHIPKLDGDGVLSSTVTLDRGATHSLITLIYICIFPVLTNRKHIIYVNSTSQNLQGSKALNVKHWQRASLLEDHTTRNK